VVVVVFEIVVFVFVFFKNIFQGTLSNFDSPKNKMEIQSSFFKIFFKKVAEIRNI